MKTILIIHILSALVLLLFIKRVTKMSEAYDLEEPGIGALIQMEEETLQLYIKVSESMQKVTQELDALRKELSKIEQSILNVRSSINITICKIHPLNG